ncbi:hypothetical protein PPROV_000308900 [Pycnococcus provasolii]|uniref:Kinesin-like protein n=1 Tax=Pycnococcus provasolii TaxID=41880 RepID=A0A830HBH3_9CHLO|nr:hypothetical protein PPROV_000308900 [Pycnococcus provasolii]
MSPPPGHGEVPSSMENISVTVRVRPLNARELGGTASASASGVGSGGHPSLSVWNVTPTSLCAGLPPASASSSSSASSTSSSQNANLGNNGGGDEYTFDHAFDQNASNGMIYEARTKHIIQAVASGFNGTVFAYGQTSSGKTHTMKGNSAEDPGIIPRAVTDIFACLHSNADREFLVRVSYLELYNEDIMDLLDEPAPLTGEAAKDMKPPPQRKLQIHESVERGVYVAGLREVLVTKPEQVLALMEQGEARRHVGETNMNARSSRSHTLFRMVVESRLKATQAADKAVSPADAVNVSVLTLVDLAGSERASKTGAEGSRLKEGAHINKSLLTLGTVINKLSEGRSDARHIPYRDSKLTRILQPSLGGNAKTAIICNVTPSPLHMEETLSTLRFASRAKQVTNNAVVNEVLSDQALLRRQAEEINSLNRRLKGLSSGGSANLDERTELEEQIEQVRREALDKERENDLLRAELAERATKSDEQEKRIANLSRIVLSSALDGGDSRASAIGGSGDVGTGSRRKRRETWCFGKAKAALPSSGSNVVMDTAAAAAVPSSRSRGRGTAEPVNFGDLIGTGGGDFVSIPEDFEETRTSPSKEETFNEDDDKTMVLGPVISVDLDAERPSCKELSVSIEDAETPDSTVREELSASLEAAETREASVREQLAQARAEFDVERASREAAEAREASVREELAQARADLDAERASREELSASQENASSALADELSAMKERVASLETAEMREAAMREELAQARAELDAERASREELSASQENASNALADELSAMKERVTSLETAEMREAAMREELAQARAELDAERASREQMSAVKEPAASSPEDAEVAMREELAQARAEKDRRCEQLKRMNAAYAALKNKYVSALADKENQV